MKANSIENAEAASSAAVSDLRASPSIGLVVARCHRCAAQLSFHMADVGAVPFWRQVLACSQASAVQTLAGRHTPATTSHCGLAILMLITA